MNILLAPRSSDGSEPVCPVGNTSDIEIIHAVGNLTFHEFATVLSGSCALASWLISCFLVFRHATNYTNPVQQRQIIRIILLVPWCALFCFLIVWQSQAGAYLVESLDFGCAVSLAAFLLLLCDYVLSASNGFDELFGPGAQQRGVLAGKSPSWLKSIWYGVLQFIPTSLIIWLVTAITLAVRVYCETSNSPRFAHIWMTIFKVVVTIISVVCVFKFYGREKRLLKPHGVFLKFFAFKGIIGLNVLQTFIVNILSGQDVIQPFEYLTYHDIHSLPSFLLACEMPLFAILIVVSFPLPSSKMGKAQLQAQ